MALSLQQVHRQTQRLIMTPQMQQSIQLLQMNSLELEQLTQQELLENPFLQLEEDRSDEGEEFIAAEPSANGAEAPAEAGADAGPDAKPDEDMFAKVEAEVERAAQADLDPVDYTPPTDETPPAPGPIEAAEAPVAAETIEEHPEQFDEVDLNWDDYYDESENRASTHEPDREEYDFQEFTAAKESLYEHLMWQLRLSSLEGKDAEIGEYLVGCIDDDGYLGPDAEAEAAENCSAELAQVQRVLAIIQEFEPTGVAARTPAECLLLQMKALGSYTEVARRAIEEHFDSLQKKKFKEIAKALEVDEKVIVELYHKVSRLEPRPGRSYTKDSIQYITPDVHVKIIDGELTIYLNEGSSGHLSVNRLYRRLLRMRERALTKEDKAYALEKFRGALMLIKNIEKRKSTILRVTEAIMEVQRAFLDKGVEALRPLTLREVAEMVGMHESTIARVTSRKYVETPQGVFSLKFFFSSAIESAGDIGGTVSSRTIKDKLQTLIGQEEPKRPLSDQKIAEILNKDGFNIARRTVAKYREQLKILPAKLRRKA